MSQIFDALKRSEAEQSGTESPLTESTLPVATDLLELAERKRRTARGTVTDRQITRPEIDRQETDRPDRQEPPSMVDRFPALAVSIPPDSRLVSVGEEESLGAEKFRF